MGAKMFDKPILPRFQLAPKPDFLLERLARLQLDADCRICAVDGNQSPASWRLAVNRVAIPEKQVERAGIVQLQLRLLGVGGSRLASRRALSSCGGT